MQTIFWKLLRKWLFSDFGHKTPGRMVKLPLRVQWNSDGKLYFLGKMKIFFVVSTHYVKQFRNFKRNCQGCQFSFHHFQSNFLKKRCLNETVYRFSPNFDSQQKTLGRVLTSASYASRGTVWRRTAFWKDLFFQFGWVISGRVENRNRNVQKNIFGDFFLKNRFFVLILGLWAKILWLFAKNFRQFFQNWHHVSRRTNWEDKFFVENWGFLIISAFCAITYYNFWQKWFPKACQKRFLLVQRNFLMKTIFWKLLRKWLFSDFGHKTLGRMVKLPLRVQWNSDGKLYFLGKMKIFLSFPHIMWNNFATSNEIARVVNLAFIISSRTFWKNVVWMKQFTGFHQILTLNKKHWVEFSHLLPTRRGEQFGGEPDFEKIFFFNLAEWFLVELRTAIEMSRRTFSATFFWKIGFLSWFSDFEQKSCDFSLKTSGNSFRTDIMCPEVQIEKSNFLWKIEVFLSFPLFAQ